MGFGKDGKGAIVREQTTISLGGLAGQDAVGVDSSVLLDADFRILKSEVTAVVRALTTTEGNGLILYMTQGLLSVAQAEATIELFGPVRPGERIEEEIAERWVRRLGITHGGDIATERVFTNEEGGGLLKINPRWTFRRGRTASQGGWNWLVYNSGATITTGGVVDLLATHYGVWVD